MVPVKVCPTYHEEDGVCVAEEDKVAQDEGPGGDDHEGDGLAVAVDDAAECGGSADGDEVGDGQEGGGHSGGEAATGLLHDLGGHLVESEDALVEEAANEEEDPCRLGEREDLRELGQVIVLLLLALHDGLLDVLGAGVVEGHEEQTHEEGEDAHACAEPHGEGDSVVGEGGRHSEVDGGANAGESEDKTEDESKVLAGEPANNEGVLDDGERLAAKTEHEATKHTQGISLRLNTETEQNLTEQNQRAEEDSTLANTGDTINDEATEESEDSVGPRVDGVEESVVRIAIITGTKPCLELGLNCTGSAARKGKHGI